MSSRSRQQRKRGVTQTTTNEYGEVQVRKMVRTKEKRVIPALTLKRMPSNILGLAFGLFAGINYVHNKELLDTELFVEMRAEFIGIYRFLIGSIGVAIATFLSWALLSNGFKFKKYPIAFRQLLSLVFIFYLAMAIMSPFINNPMLRHQDEMNNASSDVDLSRLNSPFYTELLEGLLNLIGNIPNPQELMATIHPGTGEPVFDPSVDRYLWRWLVAEYYDPQKLDFSKGHETFTNTYKATDSTAGLTGATRSFEINQNFFSFTPGYQNEAVTTWNSVEGSLIQNYNNLQAVDVNSSALALANKDGFRDINEQPVLKFNLPASGTEGNLTYNSFWLEEDKDAISQNSILYSDLNSALSSISNDERFGSIASAGGISAVWGLDSLPGGSAYVNNVADGFYFNQRYQQILSTITAETTVYSLVLSISNDISQAVLNGINDGSLVIEAANDTADDAGAPDGVDKAYYFYQQLATGGTYGIKEVLAGFNNMIRAFNIPARPIVGFSVGDVSPEEIVLRMRHLHVWIEALIPRTDGEISWGMFNAIPDPRIVESESEFEFGRNALGGLPEVQLEVTSGDRLPFFGTPIQGQNSYSKQIFGQNYTGRVRVLYDGNPSYGTRLELKILAEGDISGDFATMNEASISLGHVTTPVTTDGWANFTILADLDGSLYRVHANGTNELISGLDINILNPGGVSGTYNIYGFFVSYSIAYNFTLVGWDVEGQMSMNLYSTTPISLETIPVPPADTVSGSVLVLGEDLTVAVRITDLDSSPISGVDTIELLLMDYTNFPTFIAQVIVGTFDSTSYRQAVFPATNASGWSEVDWTVPLSVTSNSQMLVAWVANTLINVTIPVLVTDAISSISDLDFELYKNVLYANESVIWTVYSDAQLDLGGFGTRYTQGHDLGYYLIKKAAYESNNATYAALISYLGGNCVIDTSFSSCYVVDPASQNAFYNISGSSVSTFGYTNLTLSLTGGVLSVGSYYLVTVFFDFDIHLNSVAFHISSSFGNSDLLNNNEYIFGSIEDYKNVDDSIHNQPNTHKNTNIDIRFVTLVASILIIFSYKIYSNKSRRI